MAVNKIRLRRNQIKDGVYDRQLIFPLGQTYDEAGRGDLIEVYQNEVIDKLVGIKKDYEVARYTHAPLPNGGDPSPNLFYNFNFGALISSNPSTFTITNTSHPIVKGVWGDNAPCPDKLQDYYPDNSTNAIYEPFVPTDLTTGYGYDFQ